MPCFPAQLQAPAKSFLRPGTWMPGAKDCHGYTERWKVDGDPEHCVDEMMNVVEHLNETEHPSEFFVNKVRHQDHWMQIYAYTPTGWLDIVEMSFLPFGNNTSLAKISSFSTGMLPAWLPFGFLCDVMLCWCPFPDQGRNKFRCQLLRDSLPFNVSVMNETEDEQLLPRSHSKNPVKYMKSTPYGGIDTQKNK